MMSGPPGRATLEYRALATDFDGTIAHDGQVPPTTCEALERARAAGLRLLLVTGRELPSLLDVFPQVGLFDTVVAENGALLFTPASGAVRQLAPPPPAVFVDRLTREGVPISVGASIVATVEPHGGQVLAAIRELGLEWHVILNKGAVMALPAGVTKATGLTPALAELSVDAAETIAIGDAENDTDLLEMCGLRVAVGNATPGLKAGADIVTVGARGEGVEELIGRLLSGGLEMTRARAASERRPAGR